MLALPATLYCFPADGVPANAAGRNTTKRMSNAPPSENSKRQLYLLMQTRLNILTTGLIVHHTTHMQSPEGVVLHSSDLVPSEVKDPKVLQATEHVGGDQVDQVAVEGQF